MKKILTGCCFLTIILSSAQGSLMDQLQIKSPQTYAFEKYGNIPVNLYTGMIDMKVPLCNLNIDGESPINVLLSYDSSGFIPHKKGDLGGMGWSLIAGGRISRNVNRMPDEYQGNPQSLGGNPFDSGLNLHGFLTGVRLSPLTNTQAYNLYSGAGGISASNWWLGSSANGYEGEPDLFNFSVLGLSGKFMIGNDGKVLVESNDPNIKVDVSGLQSYGTVNDCKLTPSQIIIKDGKGNTYYFGGDFSKLEVSYSVPSYNGTGNNTTSPYYTINAWSVNKIDFANGKTITFNYVSDNLNLNFCQKDIANTQANNAKVLSLDTFFQDGARSGYVKNCPGGIVGCMTSSESGGSNSENYILLKKSLLESISYNNTSIFINYKDVGYPIVQHNLATKFLNEFVIDYVSLKQGNNVIKNYQFNYVDYGGTNKRPFLNSITETKSNSKYLFEYYNTGNLPKYYTKGIDHWGFWNGKDTNTTLLAYDTYNSTTGDYTLNNTVRDPNISLYNVGLLSKITYPTSGYTTFEYEPQYYGKRIERNSGSAFLPTLTNNSGYIGGARIKRQYDYSENGGLTNEKEYQYSTALNGTTSSGILMNWPRYVYFIEWIGSGFYSNLFLKNSSNVQQNSLDSYNIGYSKVYEIDKNKGYVEHNFYSYQDTPDLLSPDTSNIRNYFDNPPSSGIYPSYPNNLYKNFKNLYGIDKSIMRGRPKSDIIYTQNSVTPIKMVEYSYTDNTDYNPNNNQDNNNYVSINHLSGEWVQGYKRYFNSSALKKKTTTDYLNGNSIVSTTDYYFESALNLNLTREINTLSDNNQIKTTYQYTEDLRHGNQPQQNIPPYQSVPYMVVKNMIGIPLIISSYRNNIFQNRNQTTFDYNPSTAVVLPKSSIKYSEDQTITTPNNGYGSVVVPNPAYGITDITYDQYDSKGNLQQYTPNSGIPVAIIWGYNQTQPIAKIEGATYAQVSSLATAIINASDTDALAVPGSDESALLNALETFRNDSTLAGYQITTYTHDPLIGVRSITPPSGIRETYIYDTANRLKEVRDVNGTILKSYEYHYKP